MRQKKNVERDVATTSVPQSPGFESWAYRPITLKENFVASLYLSREMPG